MDCSPPLVTLRGVFVAINMPHTQEKIEAHKHTIAVMTVTMIPTVLLFILYSPLQFSIRRTRAEGKRIRLSIDFIHAVSHRVPVRAA
jgi:hypothetical protein